MARARPPGYAGARGLIELAAAAHLGESWLVQPKLDGQYVHVHTDRDGVVFEVTTRTQRPLTCGLIGLRLGIPYSELVGEYTGHTEAGRRRAELDGWDSCWLHDAVRVNGARLERLSYDERRDELGRARGRAMARDPDRTWWRDDAGNVHDERTGRFTRPVPQGWKRFPLVPQRFASLADQVMADFVDPPESWAEGLVFVAAAAPLGKRRGKLKWKPVRTLDARVLATSARTLYLEWGGALFTVARPQRLGTVSVGALVEIACEGFYETSSTPRFARVTRVRTDL